ncbi:MAG: glucose-1-phosphate thymidylyltransferase [Elusimicrobia bacterium HGW-Elusimicrobia-2]|nr:MAG: glucose-1-phosphate thymidylyltransferase [Elusimicrobia bacterium HGW-Elusimicrobia-2]
MTFKAEDFFDLSGFPHREIFKDVETVWEVLPLIGDYIKKHIKPNVSAIRNGGDLITEKKVLENGAVVHAGALLMDDNIELGPGVVVEPGAMITGPVIIGEKSEVRQGAYIRGKVITGPGCVIGHTTEIKNAIMTGQSKAGHFAYIGDSVLGKVNLGAGTKLANFKLTEDIINVRDGVEKISTGLRKFGAILGDGVSTGCNSVTMPGTILSKNCMVYPNFTIRGTWENGTIIKWNMGTPYVEERK